ncbi:hypothetical protein TNCV_3866581 [Trichonephila clavipes]|nr:hypothetical protein TNCV_3866581 [Trichonephila clavipes]
MDAVDFLHYENPPTWTQRTWAYKANAKPTTPPNRPLMKIFLSNDSYCTRIDVVAGPIRLHLMNAPSLDKTVSRCFSDDHSLLILINLTCLRRDWKPFPCRVPKKNYGKWLMGNGDKSFRTP